MADEFRAFWSVIPATVIDDMSLQANAKILYGILSSLMRKDGFCRASNAQLAEAMHCSEDGIKRWVSALAEAGHIRVRIEPNRVVGGTTRYISPSLKSQNQAKNDGGTGTNVPGGTGTNVPGGTGTNVPGGTGTNFPGVGGQTSPSLYKDGNIKKKKEKEKAPAEAVAARLLNDAERAGPEVREAMGRFLRMRDELKKPIKSAQAASLLWNKLEKLSNGHAQTMVALLDKATERQWLSLYALKEDEQQPQAAAADPGTVDVSGLRFV